MFRRFYLMCICSAFFLLSCDQGGDPIEQGSFELNFRPFVGGQELILGEEYPNIRERAFQIDLLQMYIADITLIKQNGDEILLSEIELFDLGQGGAVRHGGGAFALFDEIDVGSYRGISFGIGVPDRLNTEPADYSVDHPLNVGNSMYWSWKTGYKFIQMEGFIDQSPDKRGASLDHPLVYHMGQDSLGTDQSLYRELRFTDSRHSFQISSGQEIQFIIELDINRMFYTETDTIDMVSNNTSHSAPGKEFELSKQIINNLVAGALFKVPF